MQDHIAACAAQYLATTPVLVAQATGLGTADSARSLLRATTAGLLRRRLLPGRGNSPVYLPTARAADISSISSPAFLRATVTNDSAARALLRGSVVFQHAPSLAWLSIDSIRSLLRGHGISEAGHSLPAAGRDESGCLHIFVPVLRAPDPAGFIANAAAHLHPLLTEAPALLHFVAEVGTAAALGEAMAAIQPGRAAARELADLDREIATDVTGTARIRLASRRAALSAAIDEPLQFPWLGEVVHARLGAE